MLPRHCHSFCKAHIRKENTLGHKITLCVCFTHVCLCMLKEGGLSSVCCCLHIDRLIASILLFCGDCKIIPNVEFVNEKEQRVI